MLSGSKKNKYNSDGDGVMVSAQEYAEVEVPDMVCKVEGIRELGHNASPSEPVVKIEAVDENIVKCESDPAQHVVVKYDYDVIEQDQVELSPAQHEHNPTQPTMHETKDCSDVPLHSPLKPMVAMRKDGSEVAECDELGPAEAAGACAMIMGPASPEVFEQADVENIELDGDANFEVHDSNICVCCAVYSPVSDASLPPYEAHCVDLCNHTSPGTDNESAPQSKGSLGGQIEKFLRGLRTLSDDVDESSAYSQCSRDEFHQVFVDPEEGLVLNLKC